jgi:4-hydroxy-tetrahydrodipicolinate reductase
MARLLGGRFSNVEVTEIHHRFKKDAPSGTALRMAEVVAEALGPRPRQHRRVRPPGSAGGANAEGESASSRCAPAIVVGDHTVSFGTLGERLELTHRSHNRDNYARGALRAARFVAARRPGLYSMQDVLGLGGCASFASRPRERFASAWWKAPIVVEYAGTPFGPSACGRKNTRFRP